MAKKVNLNDLVTGTKTPSWARAAREDFLRKEKEREGTRANREQEALAIIDSIEADGTTLSEAQREQIVQQFVQTGELNFPVSTAQEAPVLPERADFSDVTARVATGPGVDTNVDINPVTGRPYSTTRAISAEDAYNNIPLNPIEFIRDQGAALRESARTSVAGVLENLGPLTSGAINTLTLPGIIASATGNPLPAGRTPERLKNFAAALRQEARDIAITGLSDRARVGRELGQETTGLLDTTGMYLRNPSLVGDALGTQAGQLVASLPGLVAGPTGMLVAGGVIGAGAAADEARSNVLASGGTEEEAEQAAGTAGALSAAINTVVPKVVPKGMSLENLLAGQVSRGVSRSAVRAAAAPIIGEQVTEGFTEMLDQAAINFASGQSLGEGLGKAYAQGSIIGTSLGSAPGARDAVQSLRNRRARATENEDNILRNLPVMPETVPEPQQGDLFGDAPADSPSFEEQEAARQKSYEEDAAWKQRNKEREAEERDIRREELRNSYVNRVDTARQEVEALQDEVDDGATDSATLNSLAAAVRKQRDAEQALANLDASYETPSTKTETTPTPAQEKAPVQRDFVAEQAEQQRVRDINDIARRREAVSKKAAADAEKANKKAANATRAERNQAIDALMKDNPDMTDDQLVELLPAKIAEVQKANADKANKKSAPKAAPTKKATAKKAAPAKSGPPTDKEISAELRRMGFNSWSDAPESAVEAAIDRIESSRKKPKKVEFKTVDQLRATGNAEDSFAAEAMEKLGLGMAAKGEAADAEAGDFAAKAREIGRALAGNSSRQAAAVEDLVRQGKLIIAPSAKAVGRSEQGRVGEYDLSDGKMYVYADKLSDNPIADIIEAASHESGHAGTFNQRKGRDAVMRALVGDEKVIEAADKLRKSKHKLAVDAVAKAEADSAERGDTQYEDAEIVGYFIGNVAESRNTVLGTVGGTVRDLISGARDVVRNKLGVDLDISVGDLNTAASRVMEEVAQTDTAGSSGVDRLGMIYPKTAKGYEQALKDGRVYTSSQGNEQFVLSDADAEMKPGAAKKLAAGVTMRLEEVMDHDVLFENMPEARDILVTVTDGLGNSMAQYTPGTDVVEVSPALVEGRAPATLRDGLLHEVQHWVQDMSAAREGFITDTSRPKAEQDAVTRFEAADAANTKAARAVLDDAQALVQGLTPATKRAAMQVVTDQNLPLHKRAAELIDMVGDNANGNANVDAFQASLDEYREAAKGFNAANRMRRARYLRNPTEAEAFFTQANSRTAQEDLPVNPETDPDYGTEVMASMGNRNSLGMAAKAPAKGALRNRNRLTTMLTAQLRNDKGLGKFVRNEVELAKAAPAEFEARANQAVGRYDRALERLAEQKNTTAKKLNDEIRDKLEEVYAAGGTPSEKKAAFAEAVKPYGKAGTALIDLRNLVDDLSTDLVKAYVDSGHKLTNADKKDLEKVIGNLGAYVHRFYAAYQGKPGKDYAKAVQKAVDKAEAKGADSLSDKQKELLERYRGATARIVEGIRIPDESQIDSTRSDTLDYLYETWIGTNDEGVSREQKIQELLAKREEVGPEELDQKATAAADALLHGTQEAAATKYYRGQKLDTGIMQKRKSIPKEIRDLMGEITDPAAALLVTVSKQAEYVARTKMLLALKDIADPNDLQPPGSDGSRIVRQNNMKPLKGEGYGPLNGYFASPSMEAMLADTRESLQNFVEAATTNNEGMGAAAEAAGRGLMKAWMKGAGGAKAASIVGNVYRYALNFAGAWAMLGTNGNVDPRTWARGLNDAVQIIRYARNPELGLKDAALPVKYRVVDSATVGDLKLLDQGKVERVIKEMSGKSPGALMRMVRTGLITSREAYAMMDVWSKIANFHHEADALRAIYKAEGVKKTDDEIYREASDIVNQTNISYVRAAPFIKAIERGGFTQFGPYLYEAHRATLANLYVGARDLHRASQMTNPKAQALAAAHGLSRIVGTGGFLTTTYLASKFLAQMWGEDEEDKRALLPEYSRNMDFVPIGKDADGFPILYAVSNIDPIGPLTDLIRAARRGDDPLEAVWDQFKENYIAPAIAGKLFDAAAITANEYLEWRVPTINGRPREPLLQQWSSKGWAATAGQMENPDVARAWAGLLETRYMPGTARAWSQSNPIAADGTVNGAMYNIARAMGARGIRYNPEVGVTSAGFEYKGAIDDLRTNLKSYIENADSVTEDELVSRVLDLQQREAEAARKFRQAFRGSEAVGLTAEDFSTHAKKVRGLSATALDGIMSGNYTYQVVNEDSLKSGAEREMRNKSKEEQEKIQAKWDAAWDILQQLQGGQ